MSVLEEMMEDAQRIAVRWNKDPTRNLSGPRYRIGGKPEKQPTSSPVENVWKKRQQILRCVQRNPGITRQQIFKRIPDANRGDIQELRATGKIHCKRGGQNNVEWFYYFGAGPKVAAE